MKTLFALSIIVPIGILTTLRLTGILQGPITIAETKTLETVKWEFDRPSTWVDLYQSKPKSLYTNVEASVNVSLYIFTYNEKIKSNLFNSDYVIMNVTVTADASNGYVENVYLVFRENYTYSEVSFFAISYEGPWILQQRYSNLSIVGYAHISNREVKGNEILKDNEKAFIRLAGVNHPSKISAQPTIHWILRSPNNQTHEMEIISEVTYFNGTAYKKVVQPFQLKLAQDDNNSFENAEEIGFGAHEAYIDDKTDPVDYYKIWLEKDQVIRVEKAYSLWYSEYFPRDLQESDQVGLDIFVYDPYRNLKTSLTYPTNATREVTFTADASGWWYIEVKYVLLDHVYLLILFPS